MSIQFVPIVGGPLPPIGSSSDEVSCAVPSITGRYPNLGPLLLCQAGIPLVDGVGPAVLERGGRLLRRQLDARASALLQTYLEGLGLQIVTDAETASLSGNGRVNMALLADGRGGGAGGVSYTHLTLPKVLLV